MSENYPDLIVFQAFKKNPFVAVQASLDKENFGVDILSFCPTEREFVYKYDVRASCSIPKEIFQKAFGISEDKTNIMFVLSRKNKDIFLSSAEKYLQHAFIYSELPAVKETCLLDRLSSNAYLFKTDGSGLYLIESKYVFSHRKRSGEGSLFIKTGPTKYINSAGNWFETSKLDRPFVYVSSDRIDYFEKQGASKAVYKFCFI